MRLQFLMTLFTLCAYNLMGQGVGIGTQQVAPSAALQVQSTTQGVLLPRVTSAQRKAIVDPEPGLLVYDLDKHTVYLFDGQRWMPMMYATTDHLLPATVVEASDGEAGDFFGKSIAIDGDYALAGAPEDQVGNQQTQGSVYIYQNNLGVWEEQVKLTAGNGDETDFFGYSVDIDGNYAVVGAPRKLINGAYSRGAVYVFVRNGNTWTEQAMLLSSDGSTGDQFGYDVAIDGEYIIASAPFNDVGGQIDRGTVYVFKRTGTSWAQQWAINPVTGLASDHIGKCIAIDSNVVAIGAPGDFNNNMMRCGAVYMFTRTGNLWSQQVMLTSVVPQEFLEFGSAIALYNGTLLVGMPAYDHNNIPGAGAVLTYGEGSGTWSYTGGLVSPEIQHGSNFGYAVALNDTHVFVGAPGNDIDFHNAAGRVWMYTRTPTLPDYLRYLDDDSVQGGDFFGYGVDVSGTQVMIGTPNKNEFTGAVYFKEID